MIADWTVEAGSDSPSIDVPWDGYVDLHWSWRSIANTEADDEYRAFRKAEKLPEVRAYPELRSILRMANGVKALTSKMDVFQLHRDEVDPELAELFPAEQTAFGLGSYLDCFTEEGRWFQRDIAPYERVARATSDYLHLLPALAGGVETVIRPARLYDEEAFGWTLYAFGFGRTALEARAVWSRVLHRAVWSFQLRFASELHALQQSTHTRASSSIG